MPHEDKERVRQRLNDLEDELNHALAGEYGIDAESDEKAFVKWLASHQPFHWFIKYYGIMTSGGFDVIIGNPPYLEQREVNYNLNLGLQTKDSGAIHAMCVERSLVILSKYGCVSMIVPLAIVSTQRMVPLQNLLENGRCVWYANYSWRPGKLFDTVNRALTIFTCVPDTKLSTFFTNYQKWKAEGRDLLMPLLQFCKAPRNRSSFWMPKLGNEIEISILQKCLFVDKLVSGLVRKNKNLIYYRTTGGLYWKVFTDVAPAFKVNDIEGNRHEKQQFQLTKIILLKYSLLY